MASVSFSPLYFSFLSSPQLFFPFVCYLCFISIFLCFSPFLLSPHLFFTHFSFPFLLPSLLLSHRLAGNELPASARRLGISQQEAFNATLSITWPFLSRLLPHPSHSHTHLPCYVESLATWLFVSPLPPTFHFFSPNDNELAPSLDFLTFQLMKCSP